MLPFFIAVPALVLPVAAAVISRPSARTLVLVGLSYLLVAASLLSVIWTNATSDASTVLDTAEGWLFVGAGLFAWVTAFSAVALLRYRRERSVA